uniref:Uncharacterized protein n=1 Tax=Moniliophthora roreri TaxID=221103 RepID=A0A0W0FKN7_MONRR
MDPSTSPLAIASTTTATPLHLLMANWSSFSFIGSLRHHMTGAYFKPKGYSTIVPDMLGYGNTAKPTDAAEYKPSLIVKDIPDQYLGRRESRERSLPWTSLVHSSGHSHSLTNSFRYRYTRGSSVTSCIIQYNPERVIAFGVLAVGYQAPSVGYEVLGYQGSPAEEGADKIIEDNFEKFMNIVYPESAKEWVSDVVPLGVHKAYLTSKERPFASPPSWMPAEVRSMSSLLCRSVETK